MNEKRNSSLELLRIIAMIFIVASHYSVHDGFELNSINLIYNKVLLQMSTLGSLGVNIFILISSYFLVSKEFDIKRVVKIMLQVLFYSLVIYIIFVLFGNIEFSIKSLITNCFPILFKNYWFATTYIILYILSPFLNKIVKLLKKQDLKKLIIVIFVMESILPTISLQNFSINSIIDFILMYMIASYIRFYSKDIILNEKKVLIITIFIILTLVLGLDLLFPKFSSYYIFLFHRNSPIMIVIAFCIFLLFLNKSFYSSFVNKIAKFTFGVYLIHDNPFIRNYIWNNIFKTSQYANSPFLILHLFLTVIIIFVICILIDYIRYISLNKIMNIIAIKVEKIYLKLCSKEKKFKI